MRDTATFNAEVGLPEDAAIDAAALRLLVLYSRILDADERAEVLTLADQLAKSSPRYADLVRCLGTKH